MQYVKPGKRAHCAFCTEPVDGRKPTWCCVRCAACTCHSCADELVHCAQTQIDVDGELERTPTSQLTPTILAESQPTQIDASSKACIVKRGAVKRANNCWGCGALNTGSVHADQPVDSNYVYMQNHSGHMTRQARNAMYACQVCPAKYCSKLCARLRNCGDEPKHPAQPIDSASMTNAIEQLIADAERAQDVPAESISSLLHKACKEPAIPTI